MNIKRLMLGVAVLYIVANVSAQEMENPVKIIDTGKRGKAYAAPLVADIDRDGKDELIVGMYDGNFRVYRNTGSKTMPEFKDYTMLQANGKNAKIYNF